MGSRTAYSSKSSATYLTGAKQIRRKHAVSPMKAPTRASSPFASHRALKASIIHSGKPMTNATTMETTATRTAVSP